MIQTRLRTRSSHAPCIIIIKVFVKHKILSLETILRVRKHTHKHRGTCTHKHSDYTKLNIHSLKQAAERFVMDEDSSTEQKEKKAGLQF